MWTDDEAYEPPHNADADEPDEFDDTDTAAHVSASYRYSLEMRQLPRISLAEEQQLAARVQAGDLSARNQLVEANLGFAHFVARFQYKRLSDIPSIYDLNDFIQAANSGLIRAADSFRPGLIHYRSGGLLVFAAYARRPINQAIERQCLPGASALSLSVQALGRLAALSGATKAYMASHGHAPTARELAAFTGRSVEEVVMLQTYSLPAYGLQEPVAPPEAAPNFDPEDDRPATVEETIAGSLTRPEAYVSYVDLHDRMGALLGQLSVQQAAVLRHYYGIDTPEVPTMKQIAEHIGRTYSRVQQLHEQALHHLRLQADVWPLGRDFYR